MACRSLVQTRGRIRAAGLCGVFLVTSNVVGVPRIGAAGFSAIFVAAQLVTAFVYDSVGAFDFQVRVARASNRVSSLLHPSVLACNTPCASQVVTPTGRRVVGLLLAMAAAVLYQIAPPRNLTNRPVQEREVELEAREREGG